MLRHTKNRFVMQQLSIGAVEKLTQIPAHTLRKWESRHGIAIPMRSQSGRRVYTAEQVEQLKLVKLLADRGHSLSHLGNLSTAELLELADLHESGPTPAPVASVGLVGPVVSGVLTGSGMVRWRHQGELEGWQPAPGALANLDALIVESDTLPSSAVEALLRFREDIPHVLVVYRFAPREVRRRLQAAGITAIQGPVQDEHLQAYLVKAAPEPTDSAQSYARPPHRFDPDELARIAAMSPNVLCECPNHIARLLMDITSFEQYSLECIDSDPAEKALHQKLSALSAQARVLFEEALVGVAAADGLTLNMRR